ncbi:MAG: radical SAM protein [Candidatus Eremiobacteraeota bacterium]|nr:radical SAM protein [Candidatus Eremiobacteraeota bacterium]
MTGPTVLVAPPLVWGQEHRMDLKPPVNLLCLSSFLRHRGVTAHVLDAVSLRLSLKALVGRIKALEPAFVGIPLYHASLGTARELIKELRQACPAAVLIGGGPSATIEPERILDELEPDCLVAGEGEMTLLETVSAPSRDSWGSIDGLCIKERGEARRTGPRAFIEDLDSLPFIDYSPISMESYFEYQQAREAPPSVFLTTSRGCPYRCVFCATPLLWPGRMRRMSPGRVIEEMKYQCARYAGANIGFLDDSFFSDRKWLDEFIRLVGSLNIHYNCIGRIDHLDSSAIDDLVRTGCDFVAFGVETGSERRQQETRKFLDIGKLREQIRYLSRYDIVTKGFFMVGFPDETPQDMADTINLAVELKSLGMRQFSLFPLIVYPGTELAGKFSIQAFNSGIYSYFPDDISGPDDFGEKHVAFYSTVPGSDINPYLNHREIVELVKMAYNMIEKGQKVTAAGILALAGERSVPADGR